MQRVKEAVRKRDRYRCVLCGMTNAEHTARHGTCLEVHRKRPGVPYAVKNCLTLCKQCHAMQPRSDHCRYLKWRGLVYVRSWGGASFSCDREEAIRYGWFPPEGKKRGFTITHSKKWITISYLGRRVSLMPYPAKRKWVVHK